MLPAACSTIWLRLTIVTAGYLNDSNGPTEEALALAMSDAHLPLLNGITAVTNEDVDFDPH